MVPNKNPDSPREPSKTVPDKTPETPLDNAGQVAVTYGAKPPKGPPNKQIHPRRRLPDVPEAPPRERDEK
jgi:hypothetical protein